MKKRLTKVPTTIPTIITNDIGNCKSAPILPLAKNGQTEKIVVNEVIIIAFILLCPASKMERSRLIPSLRSLFIVSIFNMESFMTIPQITTRPIRDIKLILTPQIHSNNREKKISMTTSDNITKGWISDSNWEAKIKYSKAMAINITTAISFTIFLLENQDPLNPTSKLPSFLTMESTSCIVALALEEGTSKATG